MVAIVMVAARVAPIAQSLRMKSKRAMPLFHPLWPLVFLKNAKMGALGLVAGAAGALGMAGALGRAGAFSLVSVGMSLMAMEVKGAVSVFMVARMGS